MNFVLLGSHRFDHHGLDLGHDGSGGRMIAALYARHAGRLAGE